MKVWTVSGILMLCFAAPAVASGVSCHFSNGNKNMMPVFYPDGTWKTPKRSGRYKIQGSGEVHVTIGKRIVVLQPSGRLSGGGKTDLDCDNRIKSLQ